MWLVRAMGWRTGTQLQAVTQAPRLMAALPLAHGDQAHLRIGTRCSLRGVRVGGERPEEHLTPTCAWLDKLHPPGRSQ